MACSCCCRSLRRQGWEVVRELGQGGQGAVFLCTDQTTRTQMVACKTILAHCGGDPTASQDQNCKKRLRLEPHGTSREDSSTSTRELSAQDASEDMQLRWEADMLERLSGVPGVLPLVSTFEGDDTCFHLLTAFCDAGTLMAKLDSCPPLFKLDDREAAPIVASLARTLARCHSRGIVHRDIKPGNILFRRINGEEEVVLADFGLAEFTPTPGETLSDCVGTSFYQAPEVIQGQYDHRADIWSLGIVLHLLLTSTLPFGMEQLPRNTPISAIHQAILCNQSELDAFGLSTSAQDLLTPILCKDPNGRLTLDELLCHPWLLPPPRRVGVARRHKKCFKRQLCGNVPAKNAMVMV